MSRTTDRARAYSTRFWGGFRFRMDPDVVQGASAALAVNPRPVMVTHRGHDTGIRVRVVVQSYVDPDGMEGPPEVVCSARPTKGGGTVDGGIWTCGGCRAALSLSALRVAREAVAAVIERARGASGPRTRIRVT